MKLHNLLILFVCVILVVSSTYQTVNSENMNTRDSKYSTSNKDTNEQFLLSIHVFSSKLDVLNHLPKLFHPLCK